MSRGHGQQRRPGVGRQQGLQQLQPARHQQGWRRRVPCAKPWRRGRWPGPGRAGARHLHAQPGGAGAAALVFRRRGPVPQPNNTTTGNDGLLASFNEFPSVPRIDAGSDTIATRGQSTPVWTYMLDDGTESRTGTSGIYTSSSHGMPTTGASMLGDVSEGGVRHSRTFRSRFTAACRLAPVSTSSRARPQSRNARRSCSRAISRWVVKARPVCSTATSPPRVAPRRSS